jgi:hypothetical protein
MLFHFNMDLAAVHRAIGGNHVGTHRNADVMISRLEGLLDQKLLDEIRRILEDGCPEKFNQEGTHQEFVEMLSYGNHPSLTQHVEKVMKTMNKEDQKDQVLTFPAWLAPFTLHLMLTPPRVCHDTQKKGLASLRRFFHAPHEFPPVQSLH